MASFIAYVAKAIWKYGAKVASQLGRVVTWIKNNWRRVAAWIAQGGAAFALEMILRALGLI